MSNEEQAQLIRHMVAIIRHLKAFNELLEPLVKGNRHRLNESLLVNNKGAIYGSNWRHKSYTT